MWEPDDAPASPPVSLPYPPCSMSPLRRGAALAGARGRARDGPTGTVPRAQGQERHAGLCLVPLGVCGTGGRKRDSHIWGGGSAGAAALLPPAAARESPVSPKRPAPAPPCWGHSSSATSAPCHSGLLFFFFCLTQARPQEPNYF